MRKFSALLLSAAILATGIQAQAASKPRETGEAKLAKAIEGRTAENLRMSSPHPRHIC